MFIFFWFWVVGFGLLVLGCWIWVVGFGLLGWNVNANDGLSHKITDNRQPKTNNQKPTTKFLKVYDNEEGEEPPCDASMDKSDLDEHLSGTATLHIYDGDLQIAQDAGKDKDRCGIEV